MQRQKTAETLQQFFVVSTQISPILVSRGKDELIVNMGEVVPYNFFTTLLNSLGEDPLSPLSRIQNLVISWCEFYGVSSIVFNLSLSLLPYVLKEIEDKLECSWMSLGDNPQMILPMFRGIYWSMR